MHLGYLPRTSKEMELYNYRSLLICLESVGLILNGRSIKTNPKFAEMIIAWNNVHTLRLLKKNLAQGLIKFYLSDAERTSIGAHSNLENRKKQFTSIITKQRFLQDRNDTAAKIKKNIPSIFDLAIPLWQKIIAATYMYKVAFKTKYFIRCPDIYYLSGLI